MVVNVIFGYVEWVFEIVNLFLKVFEWVLFMLRNGVLYKVGDEILYVLKWVF